MLTRKYLCECLRACVICNVSAYVNQGLAVWSRYEKAQLQSSIYTPTGCKGTNMTVACYTLIDEEEHRYKVDGTYLRNQH